MSTATKMTRVAFALAFLLGETIVWFLSESVLMVSLTGVIYLSVVACQAVRRIVRSRQKKQFVEVVHLAKEKELFDRICAELEKSKGYLDHNYSLLDLADAVNASRGAVSNAVNRFAGMNFRQFVNKYRVEFAINLMREDKTLLLWNIYDLSGFTNANTFILAFKKHCGKTPSEVRLEIEKGQRDSENGSYAGVRL